MTDHRDRLRVGPAVIRFGQRSTHICADSEHGKIVTRHLLTLRRLDLAAPRSDDAHSHSLPVIGDDDTGERAICLIEALDKVSSRVRRHIAEHAELLAAARLPESAFRKNAGTEVVTDVLILRKKFKPGGVNLGESDAGIIQSMDA